MMGIAMSQTGLARQLRAGSLAHTCRVTPEAALGEAVMPFETACAVSLPSSPMRGGVGQATGYGGSSQPMERPVDVTISFPFGANVDSGWRVDWIEGGQAYRVGQRRKRVSYDYDVTVDAVEISS